MGNLIAILSTVILVSTVGTLVFAVGAYIISRGNREGVNELVSDSDLPGTDAIEDQFPHRGELSAAKPAEPDSSLFTRMPSASSTSQEAKNADDEYLWK